MNQSGKPVITEQLPSDYQFLDIVDIYRNPGLRRLATALDLFILTVMGVAAVSFQLPVPASGSILFQLGIAVLLIIIYGLMQVLIHGVVIQMITGKAPGFMWKAPFMCFRTSLYLTKSSFTLVLLAPVVFAGCCILVLLFSIDSVFAFQLFLICMLNTLLFIHDLIIVREIYTFPGNILILYSGSNVKIYNQCE